MSAVLTPEGQDDSFAEATRTEVLQWLDSLSSLYPAEYFLEFSTCNRPLMIAGEVLSLTDKWSSVTFQGVMTRRGVEEDGGPCRIFSGVKQLIGLRVYVVGSMLKYSSEIDLPAFPFRRFRIERGMTAQIETYLFFFPPIAFCRRVR